MKESIYIVYHTTQVESKPIQSFPFLADAKNFVNAECANLKKVDSRDTDPDWMKFEIYEGSPVTDDGDLKDPIFTTPAYYL